MYCMYKVIKYRYCTVRDAKFLQKPNQMIGGLKYFEINGETPHVQRFVEHSAASTIAIAHGNAFQREVT